MQPIDFDKIWNLFLYNKDVPMIFNTVFFLVLFTGFFAIYLRLYQNHRAKIIYVICFSLYFYYKSSGIFFLLLIFSTVVDFSLAHWMHRVQKKAYKLLVLTICVILNIGLLCYFKYTGVFIDLYNELAQNYFGLEAAPITFSREDFVIPVGVSFFTFQSMSYLIDVYRNEIKPLSNILEYGFFVSFFPQLVAGPIVKAKEFIPQIRKPVVVSNAEFSRGLFLIMTGLFKKIIVSDYIGENFVQRIFDAPSLYSGIENLLGVYGFGLQIYCDFSGYTDMAIGIALLLGFKLAVNFDSPYQSASITEFWRRWHISLSTWLRDYLYIPLGGNRAYSVGTFLFPILFLASTLWIAIHFYLQDGVTWIFWAWGGVILLFALPPLFKRSLKDFTTSMNLFSTMLLGGFWHGMSINFVLWGALHGIALGVDKLFKEWFPVNNSRWRKILGILITFHFVSFCWIFFRAQTFDQAWAMIERIGTAFHIELIDDVFIGYIKVMVVICIGYYLHFIPRSMEDLAHRQFERFSLIAKALTLIALVFLITQVKSANPQEFIYFSF